MKEESICDISVILCCYNSSSRLRPTLEYLSKQKIRDKVKWEILLIDNNSNDNTSLVAEEFWNEFGNTTSLKIISEFKPGLSNARKKGIDCSNGEIVIFCDDDNWLDENYLQIAFDIMNEDSSIGMLGGIGEEVIEGVKPAWFEGVKLAYAVGPQNGRDGDITFKKGYVNGAGAIIKKSVLKSIYSKGFVNLLSDRVGNVLVSGGDNEIGYMIALSGHRIFYSSKLRFRHYLPENRLTISYLCRLVKGQQLTFYKIKCYEKYVLNKTFQFPDNRFYEFHKFSKNIIKLFLGFIRQKISYFDFRITLTRLVYEKLFLLLYYNNLKIEIQNVKKNVAIFKENENEFSKY